MQSFTMAFSSSPPDFFLQIALYVKKTWLIYIIKLKDWCLLEGKLKTTSMHFSRSKGLWVRDTLRRKWKCWIFLLQQRILLYSILRLSIYSYTFKSVIFSYSQKWLFGSSWHFCQRKFWFWHFQEWHFWKCMNR